MPRHFGVSERKSDLDALTEKPTAVTEQKSREREVER
jgi:hypothetical protein